MTEMLLSVKDYYWEHRVLFRTAGAGAGVVLLQGLLLIWTLRRLRELALIRERLSRLADGLALLTDTTEAGFATLSRPVPAAGEGGRRTRPASRTAVAKRIAAAAMIGEPVPAIAAREALSESEVALHLALAGSGSAPSPQGAR